MIIAVLPVFWCLNILSHSTLLLRMSEFQTETNIITVRVRGRQWYWIYKLELSNFFSTSNKRILLNDKKQISLSCNFRNGTSALFLRHSQYRQFWKNLFHNKNVFFFNKKHANLEGVNSDSSLNDVDLLKKNQVWGSKTNKAKQSWYSRNLDSSLVATAFYKVSPTNYYMHNFIFSEFICKTGSSCKVNKMVNNHHLVNDGCDLNNRDNNVFNYATNSAFFKKFVNVQEINSNSCVSFLNIFENYFVNKSVENTLQYSVALKKNNFFNLHTNYDSVFFTKIISEYSKSVSGLYFNSTNSVSSILGDNKSFTNIKEPIKYTFELKPKFGYIGTKVNLIAPLSVDNSVGTDMPILFLEIDNEYELKNLSTVVRYFMVLDQNRKQLTRFFKSRNSNIFSRDGKISGSMQQVELKFFNAKNSFSPLKVYDSVGNLTQVNGKSATYSNNIIKNSNTFIESANFSDKKLSDLDQYTPIKYNVSADVSQTQSNIRSKKNLLFNQRLLHTTSILVLPTKLNITVITNSYDVIHSWFIPGLGLKMDCVPGRSTHHTLFIDHPGIYYGQCAEICGRFHHHMPIKVAALQWEHFLLWWYHHTMNLGVHAFLKDFNKASLREFKTSSVYPITSRFLSQRPVL